MTAAALLDDAARQASPGRHPLWFRFDLCGQPCRLELAAVVQVLPWADLEPDEHGTLAGWLDLHGERVPVVDLSLRLCGVPTERVLGSRLLLIRCAAPNRAGALVAVIVAGLFDVLAQDAVADAERFHPCEVLGPVLQSLAGSLP